MKMLMTLASLGVAVAINAPAQTQPVAIRFKAMVGSEDFACGHTYKGIGTTKSTIKPIDFRFYIHNVRVLDETGKAVPVDLTQDDKWQLDNLALLDFEDASGSCGNGTPDTNTVVVGTVPAGHSYSGLEFTIGVPFEKNHTDLTAMPSPLNLTALAWVWNAGRKFMRVEVASTGKPRGYVLHLGSTGCTPNDTRITVPTSCLHPNRPEISLAGFDPAKEQVEVDLAALLKDSDVDGVPEKAGGGCMSNPKDAECSPLFASLGLALKDSEAAPRQTVFRTITPAATASAAH
jgi:uncharacterized repeat protein (TIGR04052 family)